MDRKSSELGRFQRLPSTWPNHIGVALAYRNYAHRRLVGLEYLLTRVLALITGMLITAAAVGVSAQSLELAVGCDVAAGASLPGTTHGVFRETRTTTRWVGCRSSFGSPNRSRGACGGVVPRWCLSRAATRNRRRNTSRLHGGRSGFSASRRPSCPEWRSFVELQNHTTKRRTPSPGHASNDDLVVRR